MVKYMASNQPNLIYVFPDQLRYQSCGFVGDQKAQMPNIDQFAREGTNFIHCKREARLWWGRCAVHYNFTALPPPITPEVPAQTPNTADNWQSFLAD